MSNTQIIIFLIFSFIISFLILFKPVKKLVVDLFCKKMDSIGKCPTLLCELKTVGGIEQINGHFVAFDGLQCVAR